jgi:hypothetical protein
MSDYVKVSLDNISSGAAVERFDEAFAQVISNILDENTEAKKERVITLKFKIKPLDEERRSVACLIQCNNKLAPVRDIESFMYVGQKDGELMAMQEDASQQKLPFTEEAEIIKLKEVKRNA